EYCFGALAGPAGPVAQVPTQVSATGCRLFGPLLAAKAVRATATSNAAVKATNRSRRQVASRRERSCGVENTLANAAITGRKGIVFVSCSCYAKANLPFYAQMRLTGDRSIFGFADVKYLLMRSTDCSRSRMIPGLR